MYVCVLFAYESGDDSAGSAVNGNGNGELRDGKKEFL